MEPYNEIIIVKNYVRTYVKSKSIRPKYYEKDVNKLLLKYCNSKVYKDLGKRIPDEKRYIWMPFKVVRNRKRTEKEFLVDLSTMQRVISNENKVGNPKYGIINGQELHRLTMPPYIRSKIIKSIKEQMIPLVNKLPIVHKEQLPVRIDFLLYDTYNDELSNNLDWDLDNRTIMYTKTFLDVLAGCVEIIDKQRVVTSKAIIPDDHRGYVTQTPAPLFYPVNNINQSKLVFRIRTDERDIIKNNKYYG